MLSSLCFDEQEQSGLILGFSSNASSGSRLIAIPAVNAVINAATGLMTVMTGSRSA